MRPRRLVVLLVALAGLLAVLAPSAKAAEIGLNVNGGAAAGPADLAQLGETGAKWARHFVAFNGIDLTDGGYDRLVEREHAMGVKTLFVVTGINGRAVTDPEIYARFVGRLAERYRGKVDAYEIWNEQDEAAFWPGGPNAAAYVAVLKASYRTIKAADPAATVVFGPTTGNNYAFVEQAYAAGAKGHFDAMAVHTDTACLVDSPTRYYRDNGRIARFVFLGYREVRASMLAHGDDKPIWMTEFGWSATNQVCTRGAWAGQKQAGVSEAQQAHFLREAYHCLREDPYVQVAMWFNSRDLVPDGSELNSYGLKRFDGSERPATAAFRDVAAGRDAITGPCGDFAAPRVTVHSPAPGQRIGEGDPLVVRVSSPDADVVRLTLAYATPDRRLLSVRNDGQPLSFAGGPATLQWLRFRDLPFGAHRVLVLAVDAAGNQSVTPIDVQRVRGTVAAQSAGSKVAITGLKLAGTGRVRVLSGALASPLRATIAGRVRVEWQRRRSGAWRRVHTATKPAGRPFRFTQRLASSGSWRGRVVYTGQAPHGTTTSAWRTFRVR